MKYYDFLQALIDASGENKGQHVRLEDEVSIPVELVEVHVLDDSTFDEDKQTWTKQECFFDYDYPIPKIDKKTGFSGKSQGEQCYDAAIKFAATCKKPKFCAKFARYYEFELNL